MSNLSPYRSEWEAFLDSESEETYENPMQRFVKITSFWSRRNGRNRKRKKPVHIILVEWRGRVRDFTRVGELGVFQLERLDEIATHAYAGLGYSDELGQNQHVDYVERARDDIKRLLWGE